MNKRDGNDFQYKKLKSFNARSAESERILTKYPDRLPIIVEKAKNEKGIPDIDKTKFLVPLDLTVGQFVYVVRQRIKLSPSQSLFLSIDGILPCTADTLIKLYKEHKHSDGFLYVSYFGEQTYG